MRGSRTEDKKPLHLVSAYCDENDFRKDIEQNGNYKKTIEESHGQIEVREYYQTDDIKWLVNKNKWKNLKSIGIIEKTIKKDDKETKEICYYISSLSPDIELFSKAANYICDNVRKVVNATFRLDEGKLLVTYGPCSEFDYKIICPEYKDDEKISKPYPGLEVFKYIRENRDIYFGYGKNPDEYLSLKNN